MKARIARNALRAASLVVTDRRWAPPLVAMAIGFGLFIGVAIGPSAAGTLAGAPQVIEVPGLTAGDEAGGGSESAGVSAGPTSGLGGGGGSPGAPLASVPLASEAPAPAPEEPAPTHAPRKRPQETEETQAFEGTVLLANPAAGSYSLVIEGGELISVHAAKLPPPGRVVSVSLRRLANDTFAEVEPPTAEGTAARASFRGAVTFSDPDPAAPAYTVSGRGASILVHVRPDPTGAPPALPAIGSYATVTVDIEKPGPDVPSASASPSDPTAMAGASPPCVPDPQALSKAFLPGAVLWQHRIEVEGVPSTYLDLSATLTSVCADSAQILLSADSTRESGQDILLVVPERIDPTALALGDSVLATATVEPDGTLTLAGLASDERTKGADDPTTAQGDLKR